MKFLKHKQLDRLEKQSKTTSVMLPDIDPSLCSLQFGLTKLCWTPRGANINLVVWLHRVTCILEKHARAGSAFFPAYPLADRMGTPQIGNPCLEVQSEQAGEPVLPGVCVSS